MCFEKNTWIENPDKLYLSAGLKILITNRKKQNKIISSYLIVCYYHVTYALQSEPTLYSSLNVKEPLARNRRNIWSFEPSEITGLEPTTT